MLNWNLFYLSRHTDVGLVPDSIWELSTMRRLPATPTTKRAQIAKIQSAPPNQLFNSSPRSIASPPPSPARQPSSPVTPSRTTATAATTPRRSFGRTGTGPLLFGQAKVESAPPIKIYLPMISLKSETISPELWVLSNLTVLSLRNNELATLSAGVGRLADLVELNLASNRLTYLPAEIMQLEKLANLYLTANPWLPAPPDPHAQPTTPSPPLDPQANATAAASTAPTTFNTASAIMERPRLLGELKVHFTIPTLREICTRKLLSPGQPTPTSSPASSPTHPTPTSDAHPNPKLIIETFYDGSKDWAKRHPHLAEPFLSTLFPHGGWRTTFGRHAGAQAFDPRASVCTSGVHGGEERVYYRAAVERMEWVAEGSLKGGREGEWGSSTRSLGGGGKGVGGGVRGVPVLWRGCGRGCLDWLEGSGEGGGEQEQEVGEVEGIKS